MSGLLGGVVGTATPNAAAAAVRVRRVRDGRDFDREVAANLLYEELRLLSVPELRERAGFDATRQVLIAWLICRHERERVGT